MASIGKYWNGHIYGTNTGNVALSLEGEDNALTGLIRLSDNQYGLVVYHVEGSFADGSLVLSGKPQGEYPEGVVYGDLNATGSLTPDGKLDGDWSTTAGSGGTFQFWPHNLEVRRAITGIAPEQLNTSSRTVGALRLYPADVRSLIAQISRDFSTARAVVTFNDKGNEKSIFADAFDLQLDDLPELRYLKISIQESDLNGGSRSASVELTAWGENVVRVQGAQESWTIGKSESLVRHIASFQRTLTTQVRRFGLTVNILITILVLSLLPGLPHLSQRVVFVAGAFGAQGLIAYLHRAYVPNFVLFSSKRGAGWFGKLGMEVKSWGINILAGLIPAVLYGLLKGELTGSPLARAFGWLFHQ